MNKRSRSPERGGSGEKGGVRVKEEETKDAGSTEYSTSTGCLGFGMVQVWLAFGWAASAGSSLRVLPHAPRAFSF